MLTFTKPLKDLKGMGYTFQKLYGHNYKCYHKKVGSATVWLWVAGRTIEIKDWHQHTGKVVEYYQQNRNDPAFNEPNWIGNPKGYLIVWLHRETGEIKPYDRNEKGSAIREDKLNEYYEKYQDHQEITLSKSTMEMILKEIDTLTR